MPSDLWCFLFVFLSPLSDVLLCCLGRGAGVPPSQVEKWDTLREEGRFPGPE